MSQAAAQQSPNRMEYSITAKGDKKAEVRIYDSIGRGWFGEGVTAKEFAREIRDLGDVGEIDVRINSTGGFVSEGLTIYNTLKAHLAKVIVWVDGFALSAASLIAMAGDEIKMAANSMMMIHNPADFAWGEAADLRKVADTLDKMTGTLVNTYADRTGRSKAEIAKWMDEETWMTADEAVERGFATEGVPNKSTAVACAFDPTLFRRVPEAVMQQLRDLKASAPLTSKENPMPTATAPAAPATPESPAAPAPVATPAAPATPTQPAGPTAADLQKQAADAAIAAERKRAGEITAICEKAKLPANRRDKWIADGASVEDVRAAAFDHLCATNAPVGDGYPSDTTSREPDVNAKYRKEYQEAKAAYAKAGMSEDEYVAGRRIDDGHDVLETAKPKK